MKKPFNSNVMGCLYLSEILTTPYCDCVNDVLVKKPFNSNIMGCLNLKFLLPHIAYLNNFLIVSGLLCNHESFLVNFCT